MVERSSRNSSKPSYEDLLLPRLGRESHKSPMIEAFKRREPDLIYGEGKSVEPNSHWKWLLSKAANSSLLRNLVYISWKSSLYLMHKGSSLFNSNFMHHLYANPIPEYFDFDMRRACCTPLKECFIDEVRRFGKEEPNEELLARFSTMRIPEAIKDEPALYRECQRAFTNTLKKMILKIKETSTDPIHLWAGLKEPPPNYALEEHQELLSISPNFITALSENLKNHSEIAFLHFHGEFGGIETLNPIVETLQRNQSVIYLQLSPNNFSRDQIYQLLPRLLMSAPHLKQIVISAQEGENPSGPLPEQYWQIVTQMIINHPNLESLICRNLGPLPEQFQAQIEQSGKHASIH